jgi:phosphoglycolate phosphatase
MSILQDNSNLTVIFDFDGTLADTFVTSIRIFEKMTKRAKPFTDQEISRLRGITALHVVRELRIRPWRVPWLLVRGRALMRRQMEEVIVFKDVEATLQQLKQSGATLYIMSSNSPGNIRRFLRAHGLDEYFERVYGNVGLFGKAKMLRRVIARNRIDMTQAFYVGDEGRDIEAAKRVGIRSVAVSWGFNTPELLERHHPYAIAHSPQGLAKLLLGD